MHLDDGKVLMERYCPFLKNSDLDFADFKFRSFVDALALVSFMDAFIPLTECVGLKVNDIGSGDVSPKFEHPLHLIYFSPHQSAPQQLLLSFNNISLDKSSAKTKKTLTTKPPKCHHNMQSTPM